MVTRMENDATRVLRYIAEWGQSEDDPERGQYRFSGEELAKATGLEAKRLNDAVDFLEFNGYAQVIRYLGSGPYTFGHVLLTPLGRYEYQRVASPEAETSANGTQEPRLERIPIPVGSPFGFTDLDWEFVEGERSKGQVLRVALGYQFKSESYDSDQLITNVRDHFNQAVAAYNGMKGHEPITLDFITLRAGYGEHLFNEIARDIISADIAVFEASDFNPNVMIEVGVALTWGIRVLPIKHLSKPRPPSDISGQTWADYEDSGRVFTDVNFKDSLTRMIERTMRTKASRTQGR